MLADIIAAFGRVMAEVGAILIVGGNIKGYTRVMTTTIAMETDKGEYRTRRVVPSTRSVLAWYWGRGPPC